MVAPVARESVTAIAVQGGGSKVLDVAKDTLAMANLCINQLKH
jgi:hypothetical protein